ncbi:MAG: hypothetical protein AB199_02930 [Parcubacteria bacterium C7867-004]|nr:MAG: hypothetical protein AB199_02930 [Parcubacteria bacterium C7867-004]
MNKLLFVALLGVAFLPVPANALTKAYCTQQYEPVCGAQPVQCITAPCYPQYHTYGNSCTLSSEGGTFIHAGECTASETGPVKTDKPYIPPANCTAWFDGCNSCSTGPKGQSMCTLRACMDTPTQGYCTAYGKPAVDSTLPVLQGPDLNVTTSGSVSATPADVHATATVTAEGNATTSQKGFFSVIWDTILSWFNW